MHSSAAIVPVPEKPLVLRDSFSLVITWLAFSVVTLTILIQIWYPPARPYRTVCVILVLGIMALVWRDRHETVKSLGLVHPALLTIVGALVSLRIVMHHWIPQGNSINHPGTLLLGFLGYCAWAFIQRLAMEAFVGKLLFSSGIGRDLAYILKAVVFAGFHFANLLLMPVSALFDFAASYAFFEKKVNLYYIAIAHALLGTILKVALHTLAPSLAHPFAVGPASLQ